jgi:hypothetical protein
MFLLRILAIIRETQYYKDITDIQYAAYDFVIFFSLMVATIRSRNMCESSSCLVQYLEVKLVCDLRIVEQCKISVVYNKQGHYKGIVVVYLVNFEL